MTRTPEMKCLCCDALISAATHTQGKARPAAGDFTICLYCAHVMAYTLGITLRELTTDEKIEAYSDPHINNIVAMIKSEWVKH